MYRLYWKMTIMVIFQYNLYIFVWIYHGCLTNMVYAMNPNNNEVVVYNCFSWYFTKLHFTLALDAELSLNKHWMSQNTSCIVFTLKIGTMPYHTCSKIWKSIKLPVDVSRISGWAENSVDPDQMPHSVASDLGLYCFLRTSVPILTFITVISQFVWANNIWLLDCIMI